LIAAGYERGRTVVCEKTELNEKTLANSPCI
jgi:hypothetical protein